tara:strand:+ start:1421 stop:1546 length:126 start_codon:yes stop_codon:yes gene_type:complete
MSAGCVVVAGHHLMLMVDRVLRLRIVVVVTVVDEVVLEVQD